MISVLDDISHDKRLINPNLAFLVMSHRQGKRGVVLEGSSRSGKTWSGIDFLIYLCSQHKGKVINIIRESYVSFKTTLYNDFNERFPMWGLASPFANVQERSTFKLFGNKVNLIGADNYSKFLGAGCDFLFLNECIHIPKSVFDQCEMRCKGFWWMDYNPEESEHWIYESVIKRKDVGYLRTTYKDNFLCPPEQRKKIESYQPIAKCCVVEKGILTADEALQYNRSKTLKEVTPEDIDELLRCIENEMDGTADPYMWDVYGLGLKAEKKGRIYPKLHTWNEKHHSFAQAEFIGYGIDFGFSEDPAVCVKVWRNGRDLFIKQVVHSRGLLDHELADQMFSRGYDADDDCICDSAEPKAIAQLRACGVRAWPATKGQGSVQGGIKLMKSFRIHIHEDSKEVQTDFENYCWKIDEATDKPTGEPEKKHKHSPDAAAYIVLKKVRFVET